MKRLRLLVLVACYAAFAQTHKTGQHLTVGEVVRLVEAHVSEDVIVALIHRTGQVFDLTSNDLIRLKSAGASDAIMRAMLEPSAPDSPPAIPAARPAATAARLAHNGVAALPAVHWVSHTDPMGFMVSVPDNWTVQTDRGAGRITIEGLKGERAVIWPMFIEQQIASGDNAGALLQQLARKAEGQMRWGAPEVAGNVARVLATGPREGAALLRWDSSGKGTVLYLFCVSGPAASYKSAAGIFRGILTTFEIVPDQGGQSADAPPQARAGSAVSRPPAEQITWVLWTDPHENAFRAEVPQGWNVSGGSFRQSATDIRSNLSVVSPDGQIRVSIGDASIGIFAVPNPAFARFQREGSTQAIGDGTQLHLHRYLPAPQFIRGYVEKTVARGCGAPQIGSTDQRSDLANAAAQEARSKGAASPHVTAAGIQFTCNAGGAQLSGYYAAATILVHSGMSSVWYVSPLFGYIAPPERLKEAEEVTYHALQSMGINAQWQQMENQRAGEAVARDNEHAAEIQAAARKSIAENEQKTSDMIAKGYQQRSQAYDEIARRRENAILGTVDVVDPNTGRQYKIDNYSDYHWMNSDGVVAGTRTDTAPGSDWQKMITLP